MREVIIHCFQWKISTVIFYLQKIKDQGFTSIQLTPIQECKEGTLWWRYYQPLSFFIGNDTGSKEELRELCYKANKLGLKIIMDVVLRHTATDIGELIPSIFVSKALRDRPNVWTNAKNIINFEDRQDVITGALGLPMLNYNDAYLQSVYIDFLEELSELKISGFRIDMGKHFATPEEGSNFWTNVFGRFKDKFNYAECINSSEELLDSYTPYVNVLHEINMSDKSNSVIFFMSHDTDLNEDGHTRILNDDIIKREWHYLLKDYKKSHVLFYCRPYSDLWKSESIKESNLSA